MRALQKPRQDMFQQLSEIIGEKAAEELCNGWGGLRIYVPAAASDRHPLTLALGQRATGKLCARFSGETLTIPKLDRLHRQRRHQLIVQEYREGATGSALAQKYGLHETTVYQIVARLDAKRQRELFS